MKILSGLGRWGIVVLGVVCLLLVVNLVAEYRGMQPGKIRVFTHAASPRAPEGKASSHAADDLAKYDPTIHFDALKELDSRPLPDEDRNPFQFVGGAPALGGPMATGAAPVPAPPPAPPPPPPPPLKAVGYNELPGGKKEAMVTFNEDLVVVHEGDPIGGKYKVVKIDPTMVVVQDGETQKNIELPFPQ
ncbi:MAG: hypothetical protein ACLQVL_23760 [Terriglobia bacterium]